MPTTSSNWAAPARWSARSASARIGGTLSLIGVLAGAKAEVALPLVVMRNLRLQGVTVGSRDDFAAMARAIAQHRLHPPVDRVFGFDEVPAAFAHFEGAAPLRQGVHPPRTLEYDLKPRLKSDLPRIFYLDNTSSGGSDVRPTSLGYGRHLVSRRLEDTMERVLFERAKSGYRAVRGDLVRTIQASLKAKGIRPGRGRRHLRPRYRERAEAVAGRMRPGRVRPAVRRKPGRGWSRRRRPRFSSAACSSPPTSKAMATARWSATSTAPG